jgi:hypothetical protein
MAKILSYSAYTLADGFPITAPTFRRGTIRYFNPAICAGVRDALHFTKRAPA